MATRKATPKKREWTADTLAEFKQTAAIVWRAQRSTSPTGDTFVGIRRFRIDAEGTAMPDGRCGIQVKEEGGKELLVKVNALLVKLLKSLEDGEGAEEADEPVTKKKKAAPVEQDAYLEGITKKVKAAALYVIKTKNGKFFQIEDGDVKVVAKIKEATQLSKSDAEEVLVEYDASAGLTAVKV